MQDQTFPLGSTRIQLNISKWVLEVFVDDTLKFTIAQNDSTCMLQVTDSLIELKPKDPPSNFGCLRLKQPNTNRFRIEEVEGTAGGIGVVDIRDLRTTYFWNPLNTIYLNLDREIDDSLSIQVLDIFCPPYSDKEDTAGGPQTSET